MPSLPRHRRTLCHARRRPASTSRGAVMTIGVMALGLAAGLACNPSPRTVLPQRGTTGIIAVVGAGRDDPHWRIFQATAERFAVGGLQGFTLVTSCADRASPNSQIRVLRQLESRELRGVVIHPADTAIMPTILEDLRQRGIVVVTLLTRLKSANPFLHAGVDDIALGRLMADSMYESVGGQGNILVLSAPNATDLADRALGLRERLGKLPSLRVLRELDTTDNAFVAERVLREYIERFPRLDGVISLDDWPLRNLPPDQKLLPESCRMVTFGPYPQYWNRLTDGTCAALIGAPYDKIIEAGLRMCATAAQGQPVEPPVYLAAPTAITQANITQFRATWFTWRERPADMRGRP